MKERACAAVRPLDAVVIAVVTLLFVMSGVSVATAASRPHHGITPKPKVAGIDVSSHHLPSSGGRVTIAAKVQHSTRCTLRARPAVAGLPLTKRCADKHVAWRPKIPANTSRVARHYLLTITVRGAHHQRVTRQRAVVVAAAPPPTLTRVTQSASTLPNAGGSVAFGGRVTHATTCTLTVTPTVLGVPSSHPCSGATTSWTVDLPPNPIDAPQTYTVAMTARGVGSSVASASRQVTVAAQPNPCPGQTETAPPTTTAYFSDPTTNTVQDQDAVVNAITNDICSVSPPSGGVASSISLAMYIYQLEPVTQALLWAHTYRDANVSVVLDGANMMMTDSTGQPVANPAYNDLVAGLPAGSVVLCGPNAGQAPPPPPGDATPGRQSDASSLAATPAPAPAAGTGCAGDNIMHTKLLLVSSIDTAHDSLVLTGSQNLNTHGELAAFNNGLQLVGDAATYQASAAYVSRLLADSGAAASDRQPALGLRLGSAPAVTPQGLVSEAIEPRNSPAAFPATDTYVAANDNATDSTADVLDGVSCTDPGSFAGDHSSKVARTSVQVAMYTYNSRPRVTSQLEALAGSGCRIRVLYTSMSAGTRSGLDAAGVSTRKLSDNTYEYTDGSGSGRVFIHDKYLLISGAYRVGKQTLTNQDIVLTGSENLSQPSLHQNDDIQVQLRQTADGTASTTALFTAYEANWTHIADVIAAIPAP